MQVTQHNRLQISTQNQKELNSKSVNNQVKIINDLCLYTTQGHSTGFGKSVEKGEKLTKAAQDW